MLKLIRNQNNSIIKTIFKPSYKINYLNRMNSNRLKSTVSYTIKNDVAVLKFDNKEEKVNSLSEALTKETKSIYFDLLKNDSVKGIVILSGKADNFIVGADVKLLDKCKNPEDGERLSLEGQEFFNNLEKCNKIIVSAIKGKCLGGGLELALATHYRIAVNNKDTKFGLPEVMLGLLPGAGGTQRLPQLINIPDALQMILTGKQITAKKAKKLGLIDLLIEPIGPGLNDEVVNNAEYLEKTAIEITRQLIKSHIKPNRKRNLFEKLQRAILNIKYVQDNFLFKKANDTVMKMTYGLYPAPLKIIEAVKAGLQNGPIVGYEVERKAFGELIVTNQSKSLFSLFKGQINCKKNRFGNPTKKVKNIGVLGAGLMGAGICAVSINKDFKVTLIDVNNNGLHRGFKQINDIYSTKVKRKSITNYEKDIIMSNLDTTLEYENLKNCDILIEAVFEDINLKHQIIKEAEKFVKKDCIFATNTSALPIAKIADASSRPENVIGMHYFSPVDKMQLLEIVTTDKTCDEAIKIAIDVGLKQNKLCIVVKDNPGFYTTRILSFMLSEGCRIMQEIADPKRMDRITKQYGFPVGFSTLMDEVGLDVGSKIGKYLSEVYKERIVGGNLDVGTELIKKGILGRKSGKGWFLYDSKKKGSSRELNMQALDILKKYPLKSVLANTDEELQYRLITRFVNEAVLCLEEGILNNPIEGDIGAVFGLGFPPCHGGPFRFVDTYGADKLVKWMEKFKAAYGSEFTPCNLLLEHAKDRTKKFY